MNCLIGIPFIYDDVASEIFEMSIVNINNNYNETVSGSTVEFQTDQTSRNPKKFYLGASQTPNLEFPLEIVSNTPMDIYKFHEVKDWLFGNIDGYKPLHICVDSLKPYYFNCHLVPDTDYTYSDGMRGFKCTVKCDAPWAWEHYITKSYSFTENMTNTIKIYNISADKEDTKPIVKFTLVPNQLSFSITNVSYNNLLFEFTNLQSEETLTIDSEKKIITSSTGLRRLGNMSKGNGKDFLRLKRNEYFAMSRYGIRFNYIISKCN